MRSAGEKYVDLDGPRHGDDGFLPHSSHWGVFSARWHDGRLEVRPHPGDPDPNQIIENFPGALHHRARITQPMVRRGWLERGPGPDDRRGRDEYVPMAWEAVLDLLGAELARVRDSHGPGAVFGGSYGWASAGRFHHAQSQLHRFLNTALGGYVRSVNSYSSGASSVLVPHIIGDYEDLTKRNVSWDQVAEASDIVLAFGGMALKNSMIAGGGISQHVERPAMARARARGCQFVLVGPLRADLPDEAGAEWISSIPGTDTALMMAIIHTLVVEGPPRSRFPGALHRGLAHLRALPARRDGRPAQGCPLGRRHHRCRGRHHHGACAASPRPAQPDRRVALAPARQAWRATRLDGRRARRRARARSACRAAATATRLGAIGYYGRRYSAVPMPTLPQGRNGVSDFIPVARIADMLLHPGTPYRYNGQTRTYPDIRLVYWAGGNPFHHHQDLTRLRRAFAADRHAGRARAGLDGDGAACRLRAALHHDPGARGYRRELQRSAAGRHARRDEASWRGPRRLRDLRRPRRAARRGARPSPRAAPSANGWNISTSRRAPRLAAQGLPAPSFDEFWALGTLDLPQQPDDGGRLRRFRDDPAAHPLPTPSGKIEIFSETIAGFGEADCPGHPTWFPAGRQAERRRRRSS